LAKRAQNESISRTAILRELPESVLFIKKGVLNFSIPLILTRFDRERDKPRPEKCANRRYWRANPPTSRISSGSQLRGGPEFEPDYLTGKTAVFAEDTDIRFRKMRMYRG
jgi:hypothetical protein